MVGEVAQSTGILCDGEKEAFVNVHAIVDELLWENRVTRIFPWHPRHAWHGGEGSDWSWGWFSGGHDGDVVRGKDDSGAWDRTGGVRAYIHCPTGC